MNQLCGYLPYDPHGVSDHEVWPHSVWTIFPAPLYETRGSLQRLKEPILGRPPRSAEGVQNGSLACVRVAHECNGRRSFLPKPRTPDGPTCLLFLELAVYGSYALTDDTPVVLQLLLARASGSDPSASEAAQLRVLTLDPWQTVLQVGELDLEAARRVPGMRLEDSDDQLGPVHDRNATCLLEYSGLGRGQLVVRDYETRPRFLYQLPQLFALATPEVTSAVPAALLEYTGNLDPKGGRQPP